MTGKKIEVSEVLDGFSDPILTLIEKIIENCSGPHDIDNAEDLLNRIAAKYREYKIKNTNRRYRVVSSLVAHARIAVNNKTELPRVVRDYDVDLDEVEEDNGQIRTSTW